MRGQPEAIRIKAVLNPQVGIAQIDIEVPLQGSHHGIGLERLGGFPTNRKLQIGFVVEETAKAVVGLSFAPCILDPRRRDWKIDDTLACFPGQNIM